METIPVPVAVVKRANAHAKGAIEELNRQLLTAKRSEKRERLERRIKDWQKVLDNTNTLLVQIKDNPA